MKQRTRVMPNGDELVGAAMIVKKAADADIALHRLPRPEHYIEAQVQDDDTLQAIALRFRCSIAELKRINQIHKDNEIFARRIIKIPVTPFSVLTEVVPEQHQPLSPENVPSLSNVITEENKTQGHAEQFLIDCNDVVMNSTLAPSVVPYTDVEISEPISEDTLLLPNKEKDTVETVVVKQLTSQGADFGIKWFHLVCCMLVLGVLAPLIYIMFYLDKHEHSDLPPLHSV